MAGIPMSMVMVLTTTRAIRTKGMPTTPMSTTPMRLMLRATVTRAMRMGPTAAAGTIMPMAITATPTTIPTTITPTGRTPARGMATAEA